MLLLSATFLLSFFITPIKGDWGTTGTFVLQSRNASQPTVDGKNLWIHFDGGVYLDAGVANPRLSFELITFLEDTRLRRIKQTGFTAAGSSPGTEANLNFGTWVLESPLD